MTIKENIEFIKESLETSYNILQTLEYENDIEKYIKMKLLDITSITKDINEFVYWHEKRKENKQRGNP